MDRSTIFDYQLKKSVPTEHYEKIDGADKAFYLGKATNIVDSYVNYKSGRELDYIICDIGVDMILNDIISQGAYLVSDVNPNIADIVEGDTSIKFHSPDSLISDVNRSSITNNDTYYIKTYGDMLNRYRKIRS